MHSRVTKKQEKQNIIVCILHPSFIMPTPTWISKPSWKQGKGYIFSEREGVLLGSSLLGKVAVTQEGLGIQEAPDLNLDAGRTLGELFTLSGSQFLYQ